MNLILASGVLISSAGLLGLLVCVYKGIKIKRLESDRETSQTEFNRLLGSLYVLNMISLSSSFFGLLLVILGIIFKH